MKPEWCPQDVWDKARKTARDTGCALAVGAIEMIARALLEAEQRGRRMGMEEGAKVAEGVAGGWNNIPSSRSVSSRIAAAIRAKLQEVQK